MLTDPLALRLVFDSVDGGELHSFSISAQDGLASAHVGGLQGEAAAALAGRHRVVSDVTESRRAAHPLACCAELPAGGAAQRRCGQTGRWRRVHIRWRSGPLFVYLCMVRNVLIM